MGDDVFVDEVNDYGIQHSVANLLPDDCVPVREFRVRIRFPASSTATSSLTYTYNTVSNPFRPHEGKQYTAFFQAAGLWGSVRYINPVVAYKRYIPMHYLNPSKEGRNMLGLRAQLGYIQGFGGDVAPPNNRFYAGGEQEVRGFDVRGATPYGYVPTRVNFQLTNPDGSCVPRDPTNPEDNQCIQIPLPVYGIASIGGDSNLTTNAEYRIPVIGPFDL